MKPTILLVAAVCLATIVIHSHGQDATGDAKLTVRRSSQGLELSWPGTVQTSDAAMVRPYFELQGSADLLSWQPMGQRQRATSATAAELLGVTLSASEPYSFYRLLSVQPSSVAKLGSGGAEVFGYGDAFAQELQRIGQISPEQFAALFPNGANYLPAISWDPTSAQYWDQFNADIEQVNKGKTWGEPGFRSFDTRLDAAEFAVFKKNGFVASERLGARSFADLFYALWHNDLPVFISCDALLQAWHRSYDAMLEEIEETYLFNSVQTMLDGMTAQVIAASTEAGNGVLNESLLDADYFLAVARSLLTGTNSPPITPLPVLKARVVSTLADIQDEQLKQAGDFMGFCRVVDFSQFKVRGHYTHTERLGRYFKCVMWLGRIDVPVAGGPWKRCPGLERMASPRELGVAIVLWRLLHTSGQFERWRDLEQIVQTFVGATDSMTFGQLGGLLAGAGIQTLSDVRDLATLENLQNDMARGELGVQSIRSDWFEQPLGGAARYALPRTFTVLGQKFVPDSWAFSQTVFDSILRTENGMTNKVQRRVPGALDIAFSVLGNDQIVPELLAQMNGQFADTNRPHAQRFRDSLPYQQNLAAVRGVIDLQSSSAWDSNLYTSWLACLRELSAPITALTYPEALRTRAWAMKTLNTQLASWTQLRHDTVLYAKQSYTAAGQCVYPTGYVEPRLEFWRRLRAMVTRAAELIAKLRYVGDYPMVTGRPPQFDPETGEAYDPGELKTNLISLVEIQARQMAHLQNFGRIVSRLELLATKELAHECFGDEDERFIDGMMQGSTLAGACGDFPKFSGWYPQLFYRTIYWTEDELFHTTYGAGAFDGLVTDVHTDVPCLDCGGDPGSVLHEATGRVNLLMLAVDNGADRFICAGPVLSHYEFEVIGDPRRISDQEWRGPGAWFDQNGILQMNFPDDVPASRIEGLAPPEWTGSYLVPAPRGSP